jgi:hypothetical protein
MRSVRPRSVTTKSAHLGNERMVQVADTPADLYGSDGHRGPHGEWVQRHRPKSRQLGLRIEPYPIKGDTCHLAHSGNLYSSHLRALTCHNPPVYLWEERTGQIIKFPNISLLSDRRMRDMHAGLWQ